MGYTRAGPADSGGRPKGANWPPSQGLNGGTHGERSRGEVLGALLEGDVLNNFLQGAVLWQEPLPACVLELLRVGEGPNDLLQQQLLELLMLLFWGLANLLQDGPQQLFIVHVAVRG